MTVKTKVKLLRMRSIKWKLIVMYLGLVLIVMIVSGTYILLSLRNTEIDKSRGELERYAEKINEQVIEGEARKSSSRSC